MKVAIDPIDLLVVTAAGWIGGWPLAFAAVLVLIALAVCARMLGG